MKVTVLTDNTTLIDQYYLGEPGLCLYIEDENKRFLFDTGYSDVFLRNAELMGIDLTLLDGIAISHGHNDHTRGLLYLRDAYEANPPEKKPLLLLHPGALQEKHAGEDAIGIPATKADLEAVFHIQESVGPVPLTKNLTWMGEIPRLHAFEERSCGFCGDSPDTVRDDTALVYRGKDGLVILTGCSHSGICNIVSQAMDLTGETRLADVVGGFHLLDKDRALFEPVRTFFESWKPKELHPCHCTGLAAKIALSRTLPVLETGVGMILNYC